MKLDDDGKICLWIISQYLMNPETGVASCDAVLILQYLSMDCWMMTSKNRTSVIHVYNTF